MHKSILPSLCQHFNLGAPIESEPSPVNGGLLHRMWKLNTNKGTFAVKELDANIMTRDGSHGRYNYTETFARYITSNSDIKASIALEVNNSHIYEKNGIILMVYPWVLGSQVDLYQISTQQAYEIGKVIGWIHSLHASNKYLPDNQYEITKFSNEHWDYIISETIQQVLICSSLLEFYVGQIKQWNNQYQPSPNANLVISHRDIDPKNVLWNNDRPTIIDWESAGYINPAEDLITTALNWSGIPGLRFNAANFKSLIQGYYESGSLLKLEDINQVFGNIIGGMLSWLEYNISRCINKDNSYDINMLNISSQEVIKTISTISFIDANRGNFLRFLI